jgi:hypothetical protein
MQAEKGSTAKAWNLFSLAVIHGVWVRMRGLPFAVYWQLMYVKWQKI